MPSPPQPRRPRGLHVQSVPGTSRGTSAQQLLPCCRWAGQLGSSRLLRCSRGPGPRTPLMALVRGWKTSPSGDAGILPASLSPFIHTSSFGTYLTPGTRGFHPPLQDLPAPSVLTLVYFFPFVPEEFWGARKPTKAL